MWGLTVSSQAQGCAACLMTAHVKLNVVKSGAQVSLLFVMQCVYMCDMSCFIHAAHLCLLLAPLGKNKVNDNRFENNCQLFSML